MHSNDDGDVAVLIVVTFVKLSSKTFAAPMDFGRKFSLEIKRHTEEPRCQTSTNIQQHKKREIESGSRYHWNLRKEVWYWSQYESGIRSLSKSWLSQSFKWNGKLANAALGWYMKCQNAGRGTAYNLIYRTGIHKLCQFSISQYIHNLLIYRTGFYKIWYFSNLNVSIKTMILHLLALSIYILQGGLLDWLSPFSKPKMRKNCSQLTFTWRTNYQFSIWCYCQQWTEKSAV